LADFVVLDKNSLEVEPTAIVDIKIVETIKQGQTIYAAPWAMQSVLHCAFSVTVLSCFITSATATAEQQPPAMTSFPTKTYPALLLPLSQVIHSLPSLIAGLYRARR
jgi:hypothetical protein